MIPTASDESAPHGPIRAGDSVEESPRRVAAEPDRQNDKEQLPPVRASSS